MISVYYDIVVAVSHSRMTLLLVASEVRDSKLPSNILMILMAGPPRCVTVAAPDSN